MESNSLMISRERFINILQRLEIAYSPKFQFGNDQTKFNLWYDMFSDCDEEGLLAAVDKCIKENEFPPNIATLMKCYRELEAERTDLAETIKNQYSIICSIWGEKYDPETLREIQRYIVRFPKKTRKVEMVELTHDAVSFRHDCDACGRTDIPTIKEYIQGAR